MKVPVSRDDINILSRQRGQAKPCREVPGESRGGIFCSVSSLQIITNFCGTIKNIDVTDFYSLKEPEPE